MLGQPGLNLEYLLWCTYYLLIWSLFNRGIPNLSSPDYDRYQNVDDVAKCGEEKGIKRFFVTTTNAL